MMKRQCWWKFDRRNNDRHWSIFIKKMRLASEKKGGETEDLNFWSILDSDAYQQRHWGALREKEQLTGSVSEVQEAAGNSGNTEERGQDRNWVHSTVIRIETAYSPLPSWVCDFCASLCAAQSFGVLCTLGVIDAFVFPDFELKAMGKKYNRLDLYS